jgi:DNA invertase Pin-like site-specific DNA recombinase
LIRERTRAGIAAARRRGSHIGRPRVRLDMAQARALIASGKSLRQAARTLGIGTATLHRALQTASTDDDPKPSPNDQSQILETMGVTR